MHKAAAHLRSVKMPEHPKPTTQKPEEAGMDFGFSKSLKQPQSSLDEAYGFWKKNPSQDNMIKLIDIATPVLRQAITSYAAGDKTYMSRAKKLAVDAFANYDPARGTKLRSYLLLQLQPLQRAHVKRTSAVAVPERVQLDRYRLDQAEEQLKNELGREPADIELADHTGFSAKRIAHIRSFARGTLAESQLMDPEKGLQLPATEHVTGDDLWVEYVHHDLAPVDQKIMEWKLGIYGKKQLSTNEIAKRLNLTPSAVSQRAARIAAKLEHSYGP
jgi:DNA-directed RNA polymerase specialized sigma subunit